MLNCNGFGTYVTFANNIILCRFPSHSSYKLQPYDVAVFA